MRNHSQKGQFLIYIFNDKKQKCKHANKNITKKKRFSDIVNTGKNIVFDNLNVIEESVKEYLI